MVQRQNKWVETLLVAAFISSAISPVRGFSVCPVGLRGKGLHLPHGVGQHAGAAGRAGHRSPLLMQVTEKDTFVRPSARGKRDIVFGTSVTTSCPVAPKHDEGFNLVWKSSSMFHTNGAMLSMYPSAKGDLRMFFSACQGYLSALPSDMHSVRSSQRICSCRQINMFSSRFQTTPSSKRKAKTCSPSGCQNFRSSTSGCGRT